MNNLMSIGAPAIIGIIAGVVAIGLIIFFCWYITTANAIIRLKNNVDEGWSTIDVYLKKRYDLIPNLVETVKGYAAHEKGTLEAVIAARNSAMSAGGGSGGIEGRAQAESALSGTLKTLFALSEAYPTLKADSQFLDLQRQLQSLESEISQARKYYNGVTKAYNNKIMTFPSSFVARRKGFEKVSFFEAVGVERENVRVSF